MKYLMMIKHSEAHRSQPVPEGLLRAMGEFVDESITAGGHVTCWGNFIPSPTEVPGVSGIVRITGGDPGFCGLDAAGGMSCWDQRPETAGFTPAVPIAQVLAPDNPEVPPPGARR
jgi:hypothetical protein